MNHAGFWAMGAYGRYVWPCFGFAAVVLAWNVWSARRHLATARLRAQRVLAMAESGT
jgi:heme exporter protein CcmD